LNDLNVVCCVYMFFFWQVGHRKQVLRGIAELRVSAGLPPMSPRGEEESVVVVGGTDGTLHRRIAKKQETDSEVYVKG
jgi:hypothetical protein